MDPRDCDDMSPTSPATSLAQKILEIRKHQSSLEKYKTELSELKKEHSEAGMRYSQAAERYSQVGEKIFKKEVEVEEAIAQSNEVLKEVYESSQEDFNALMKTGIGDHIKEEGRNMGDDGESKDDLDNGEGMAEMKTGSDGTEDRVHQRDDSSPIALSLLAELRRPRNEETVTDETIQFKRDSLKQRQTSIDRMLEIKKQEQERVRLLIKSEKDETKRTELMTEKQTLEEELERLGQQYYERNRDDTDVSLEESHAYLKSRGDNTPYVQAVRKLEQIEDDLSKLSHLRKFQPKFRDNQETATSLQNEVNKLAEEKAVCESEERELEKAPKDLITAAMKWAKWASYGLYVPDVSTATVVFLLFQQYCRQQVPFKRLEPTEKDKYNSALGRLTSPSAPVGLNLAMCMATAAREVGYSAGELKQGGHSTEEIHGAGYSLLEMKEGNISAGDLKQLGYPANELKRVGYAAGELKRGGYPIEDINAARYSLPAMKSGGFTANELKLLQYKAPALQEVGYSVRDLMDGNYSAKEICEASYPLAELKTAGISAAELMPLYEPNKNFVQELKLAGYTAAQVIEGNDLPEEIKKNETLQNTGESGVSAEQPKTLGYEAEIKRVYTLQNMRESKVSAKQLKTVGYEAKNSELPLFSPLI
jgi:hypothetical protein